MGLTLLNLRRGNIPVEERAGMVLLNLSEAAEQARLADERRIAEAATKKVQEAISPQIFSLTAGDAEDVRFQRITSPRTLRDLNPLMQERMQQVCFYLKVTTPFGGRIVQLISEFVSAEGFDPVAEDPQVQQIIDDFWNDPVNALNRTLKEWTEEESTFGELCIPVAVNPVDGKVRLGYIDPQRIDAIEYGELQTGDGRQVISIPIAVLLKRDLYTEAQRLSIVRRDEDPNSPTFGKLTGECFYFAINKAKSATRGISDLFNLADWIDVFDQMIFDFADRVRFLNAFVWHYTLKGAGGKEVEEYLKKLTKQPPRQGGVQVTNDMVEIEARTPQLQGADMSNIVDTIKKYGLGGKGFSPMFFGDPVDSNKSTAQQMEGPTGKMLTARQNHIKQIVLEILAFVVDQAVAHGVLPESVNRAHSLQVPDLLMKDLVRASTTMQAVGAALTLAEDRGWIRGETSARAFHTILTQIGVAVNSKEEYLLAQQELARRQAREIDGLNPQSKLADALKALQTDPEGTVQ